MLPCWAAEKDIVRSSKDTLGWEMVGWRAARMGDWKATWISAPFGASDWQLFDLAQDPGEALDLAGQHPELMQRLVDLWEAYSDEVGVVLPEAELPIPF